MKNLLISAMLGSTAMMGAALAQETAAPEVVQTEGVQTAPAPMLEEGQHVGMDDEMQGFVTWQDQDQMIASNLMGANVLGAEGEVIGNVDDLLLDRDGRIIAAVVGIGGFLGLGERNVAISADRLEFVLAQDAAAGGGAAVGQGAAVQDEAATNGTAGTNAAGTMETDVTDPGATPVPDTGETAQIPTGETVTAEAVGGETTGGGLGWTGSGIDHIQVNFTREQLEAAPPFEATE